MAFWSFNGGLGPGPNQMQASLEERPAAPQHEAIATAGRHENSFIHDEQNPLGAYNSGLSQSFDASFDAQLAATNGSNCDINAAINVNNVNNVNNANDAHYGNGGALPVSASSHAKLPPASSYSYAYNTFDTTGPTTSDVPQPLINRSSNASPSILPGLGPLMTPSALNVPSPEPSSHNHVGPDGVQRNAASLTVERPSTHYDLPTTVGLPSSVTGGRKPLPSQLQHSHSSTGVSSHGAAAQWTATAQAKATAQPIASTLSAVDKESNSNSIPDRQNASSGDVPAPKPAQAPASVSKPAEGGGGTGLNKPVLRMRRTGQNSPISPVGASSPFRAPASLHQRNGSNSPGGGSTLGFPIIGIRKAADAVSEKAAGAPLLDSEAISSVSKLLDPRTEPADPSKAPNSKRCHSPLPLMDC